MRQKYVIEINEKTLMTIQELAELDKDSMSLLCEEKYKMEEIETAIKKGKKILLDTIRTKNMYPIGIYADKIADAVIRLFESAGEEKETLFFDDADLLSKEPEEPDVKEEIEEEAAELDDVLEDDLENDSENEKKTKGIKNSTKTEDDPLNADNGS